MTFGLHGMHWACLACIVTALSLPPEVALADGEYWSVDVSERANSGVLAAERGPWTFGADYTDYGDGVAANLSLTRRLPFDFGLEGLNIALGPALGFGGSDLSKVEPGLNFGVSRYIPTDFGAVFLQAAGGTGRWSFFAQTEVTLSEPGVSFSLARGSSLDYEETSIAVRKELGDGPVSLRAGYRFVADEFFVGFSVNTF